jgi:hypothetical protein
MEISSRVAVVSCPAKRRLNQVKASPRLCYQLAGEQLRQDAQVAGVGAKLGQEGFGGVVARIRWEIGKEILERF